MKTTKHLSVAAVLTVLMQMGCQSHTDNTRQTLHLPELNEVRIEDAFWSPKLDIWRKITANDVLNKFEGKYTPFPGSTDTRNAFRNFDRVAEGQRDKMCIRDSSKTFKRFCGVTPNEFKNGKSQ